MSEQNVCPKCGSDLVIGKVAIAEHKFRLMCAKMCGFVTPYYTTRELFTELAQSQRREREALAREAALREALHRIASQSTSCVDDACCVGSLVLEARKALSDPSPAQELLRLAEVGRLVEESKPASIYHPNTVITIRGNGHAEVTIGKIDSDGCSRRLVYLGDILLEALQAWKAQEGGDK